MHLPFDVIACLVVILNFGVAALQVRLIRRNKFGPAWLGKAVVLWAAALSGLFIFHLFSPLSWHPFMRHWFYFPMSLEIIWNLLFLQAVFILTLLLTIADAFRRPTLPPTSTDTTGRSITRRRFIYTVATGAAPITAVGMGIHGTLTRHDIIVPEMKVPVTDLPPELEGFSIAHVSDLHSGIFCGPTRLEIIQRATDGLNPDLVVVTGDIINTDMSEFAPALKAIQGMHSRYGTFICEGNHDIIPGLGLVRAECIKNGLPFLYNSTVALPVNGRRLILAGLPWMRGGIETSPEFIGKLYPEREDGDVRILLAHHPHVFDIANDADVVLSGHTHGGQMMAGPVGLGPLFFKYWSGLYRRGNTSLVVSNGCGDWFPCRIGAPAEVALLRLTKAGI